MAKLAILPTDSADFPAEMAAILAMGLPPPSLPIPKRDTILTKNKPRKAATKV